AAVSGRKLHGDCATHEGGNLRIPLLRLCKGCGAKSCRGDLQRIWTGHPGNHGGTSPGASEGKRNFPEKAEGDCGVLREKQGVPGTDDVFGTLQGNAQKGKSDPAEISQ